MSTSIYIAIASILAIAGVAVLLSRISHIRICPVCAGVGGTWVWMLTFRELGWVTDERVILLLMGGSVVGIAYQIERRFARRPSAAFKLLFTVAGMAAAVAVVEGAWIVFGVAFGVGAISLLLLRWGIGKASEKAGELEKRLEQCC